MMFCIAGMMFILAILMVWENRNHQNFYGFLVVSVWTAILGIFAGCVGLLML